MVPPTISLLESSQLVKQGAEAKVYKCWLHPSGSVCPDNEASPSSFEPVLLKYRFKKSYRHPTLNSSLTKSRVAGEARALLKCLRSGVNVPGVRMVDAVEGVICIEWIEGKSVRALLGDQEDPEGLGDSLEPGAAQDCDDGEQFADFGTTQSEVMTNIGTELGKMHKADVVHGDLTTSNMMLRKHAKNAQRDIDSDGQLVLIDFGLSYVSALAEDKAVDLYVLERAFTSTHPDSEPLFALVLEAYAKEVGKDWKPISKKLDEVRLRGRKRSMVG